MAKEEKKTEDRATVRVFSTRPGRIRLNADTLITKDSVILVTEDQAKYLEVTFKGFVKRVG